MLANPQRKKRLVTRIKGKVYDFVLSIPPCALTLSVLTMGIIIIAIKLNKGSIQVNISAIHVDELSCSVR